MGRLLTLLQIPIIALLSLRGLLFPWVPVLIGVGVGFWFAFADEPGLWFYATMMAVLGLKIFFYRVGPEVLHTALIAVACVVLGMLAAGARAHLLDAPVLGFRYYGPVEGRIVMIDRSMSGHIRLTLDQVVLSQVAPEKTPVRVRVSLQGDQAFLELAPGETILTTGHLSAPEGPVEPGGFDFRRMAFFDQLGAVGYSRVPVLLLAPPKPGAQWINQQRSRIRARVEAQVAGDAGAFAAALVTGDRAGISRAAQDNLRGSNLAHLLAISGLHMALLTGFIFATLRYGLALVPMLALRINTKKLAAGLALVAGAIYLALSGGNVATERAFVMVAVMLGAVLFDRRALSMRSVALAASVLLLVQPETLLEPGFQMSFAATVALIAGYSSLRLRKAAMPTWMMPVFTVVFTSLLAGLATGPVAAAHFNRIAGYGLIANVLAVPVMGVLVMPAAVLAGVLAPFGLEGPVLWIMGKGTDWILAVAQTVAGWEGAVRFVPSPSRLVLPIMALGALWVILWRGPVRFAGVVPILLSLGLWVMADRPPVLISGDGKLVGVVTASGRALSSSKGAGFSARQWLENDGDAVVQAMAAARAGFEGTAKIRHFSYEGWRILQIKGKGAEAKLPEVCAHADLVVVGARLQGEVPQGCMVFDENELRRTGPLALWPMADGGLKIVPTKTQSRLWTRERRAETRILVSPLKIKTSKLED